MGQPLV
jgi:hypothetical protein